MSVRLLSHAKQIGCALGIFVVIYLISGCAGVSTASQTDPSPTPTPTADAAPTGYLTWKNDNQRTGLQPMLSRRLVWWS